MVRGERANLWAASGAQFFTLAGMTAILPLIPLYLPHVGVEDPVQVKYWTGALGAAPFAVAVFATPLWGMLADRFGHKPMVVRSVAGLGIATLGMGLASTPATLLFWRGFQGAVSGVFPAAVALISAQTPPDRMGAAIGVLQSARAAGGLAGPFLGGILADLVGVRPLFFITGALALLMTALCQVVIREAPGAAGLSGGAKAGGGDSGSASLIDLVRAPSTIAMLALIALFQVVVMTSYPTIALFVEHLGVERERVATVTGILFACSGLPSLLTASSWGRLADRYGYVPLMVISMVATGAASFSIGMLTNQIHLLFVLRAAFGFAVAGFTPLSFAWIGTRAPAEARGRMAGLASTAMMMGNVIGPILGSWLGVHLGLAATFYVPGAIIAVAGVLLGLSRLVSGE